MSNGRCPSRFRTIIAKTAYRGQVRIEKDEEGKARTQHWTSLELSRTMYHGRVAGVPDSSLLT